MKKCKIKRVGALRGRWRVDYEKSAKLRGFGALRGRWRVDCKKKVQN